MMFVDFVSSELSWVCLLGLSDVNMLLVMVLIVWLLCESVLMLVGVIWMRWCW